MKVFLRRLVLGVAAVLILLVLGFVVVVSIGIHVDLDPLRLPAQTLASTALGRPIAIEGKMELIPTWSPTVEVEGVRIGNPEGWPSPDFARMDLARLSVSVLPALWGHAVVQELSAEGVEVNFERSADGSVNWVLALPGSGEPAGEDDDEAPFDLRELFIRSAEIEMLALRGIVVNYRDALKANHDRLELTELQGVLGTHQPLQMSLSGHIGVEPRQEAYQVSISGGPPVDLFRGEQPWPLEIVVDVADTTLSVKTRVQEPLSRGGAEGADTSGVPLLPPGRSFGRIEVSLGGEDLQSLEDLLEVDLPPWGPHGFEGTFESFEGGRYKADITVRVGESRLEGTLEARTTTPPRFEVKLSAPSVQLDDFETEGWKLVAEEPAPDTDDAGQDDGRPSALLSPETLRRLDGTLAISVERVSSGRDRLGQGRLEARLEKGRLSLDPLELEVPGGKATIGLVFQPSARGVSTEIRAEVERFDYGILARRIDPATEMGGLFALDVSLRSQAPSARDLMAHASGRFDFAIFPEDFEAGIIDLWAVNLVTAVLPAVDQTEGSRINCVVGLFDIEDGQMHQQTLVMDTSNMTVRGKAEVDFRREEIRAQLAPDAKRPQFFAAATPIQVSGDFEDFGVGARPEDLIGTAIKMVTSIVHVPIRRIFTPARSGDELATCLEAMKRAEETTPAVSAPPPSLEEVFRPAQPSSRRVRPGTPGARRR